MKLTQTVSGPIVHNAWRSYSHIYTPSTNVKLFTLPVRSTRLAAVSTFSFSTTAAVQADAQSTKHPAEHVTAHTLIIKLLDEVVDARVAAHQPTSWTSKTPQRILDVLDLTYETMEEVFMSKRGYIIPKKEKATVDATGGSSTYG